MDAEPRGPREPRSKRPDEAEIHAVLDGEITGERAAAVRRRVASDPELLGRFGPLFEVELFAGPVARGGEHGRDSDPGDAAPGTGRASGSEPSPRASRWRVSRISAGLAAAATVAAAAIVVAFLSRGPVAPSADRRTDSEVGRLVDAGREASGVGADGRMDSSANAGGAAQEPDSGAGAGAGAEPLLLAVRVTRVERSAAGAVTESWERGRLGPARRIRVERDSTGTVGLTTRTYEFVD